MHINPKTGKVALKHKHQESNDLVSGVQKIIKLGSF